MQPQKGRREKTLRIRQVAAVAKKAAVSANLQPLAPRRNLPRKAARRHDIKARFLHLRSRVFEFDYLDFDFN